MSVSGLDFVQTHKGDADLWLLTQSATKALQMRNGVKSSPYYSKRYGQPKVEDKATMVYA